MLGLIGKKSKQVDADKKTFSDYALCVEIYKQTWVKLNPKASTVEELALEIEQFSDSAFRFAYTNFPDMKKDPSAIWMAVFATVLETKIHPTDQVNKALDLLCAKYKD
jgi:hypothetical protein